MLKETMTVSKPVFFLFALLITTASFLVPKITWLAHSKTATGWADTVVYGAIPLIILLMIFFHPKGIPRNTKLYFGRQRPFASINRADF